MDSMGRGERIDRPCAVGVPGFLFGELGGRRRCCSWRWGNIFILIFFFKVEYWVKERKAFVGFLWKNSSFSFRANIA